MYTRRNGVYINYTQAVISGKVLWNDPESNDEDLRETVTVVLENGFKVDFWLLGLSEIEYIERTNQIYELER